MLDRGSTGGRPVALYWDIYRQRNTLKRCLHRLKQWRGCAPSIEAPGGRGRDETTVGADQRRSRQVATVDTTWTVIHRSWRGWRIRRDMREVVLLTTARTLLSVKTDISGATPHGPPLEPEPRGGKQYCEEHEADSAANQFM